MAGQCAGPFLDLNWGCAWVRLHDASPGQWPLTGSDLVRCDLDGPWQGGAFDTLARRKRGAFPYLLSFAHLLALVRLYPVAAQREFLGGTFPFAFSCCLFGLCLRGRRRALVTRSGSASGAGGGFGSELQ